MVCGQALSGTCAVGCGVAHCGAGARGNNPEGAAGPPSGAGDGLVGRSDQIHALGVSPGRIKRHTTKEKAVRTHEVAEVLAEQAQTARSTTHLKELLEWRVQFLRTSRKNILRERMHDIAKGKFGADIEGDPETHPLPLPRGRMRSCAASNRRLRRAPATT